MRTLAFLFLSIFLVSCSTSSKKTKDSDDLKVTNEDFKKVKPVEKSQVRDYFTNNRTELENPVLKDETLERLTNDEVKEFSSDKDPLVAMAYLCHKKSFKDAYALAAANYDRFQKIPAYWNQLGICYLDQAEYRKSLLYFNKALEAQKDYVPTLNNFGVMYSRLGQHQKAIVAFERAATVGKFSKTPRYNLAKLYLQYGLANKALPILQSLANQSKPDVGITNAIATAYLMQGDHASALRYFKMLNKDFWEKAEIGINVSYAYFLSGNVNESHKIFKDIAKPKLHEQKNYYSLMAQKIGVKL